MTCDQCQLAAINGIVCHEIGCPNSGKKWNSRAKKWVDPKGKYLPGLGAFMNKELKALLDSRGIKVPDPKPCPGCQVQPGELHKDSCTLEAPLRELLPWSGYLPGEIKEITDLLRLPSRSKPLRSFLANETPEKETIQ